MEAGVAGPIGVIVARPAMTESKHGSVSVTVRSLFTAASLALVLLKSKHFASLKGALWVSDIFHLPSSCISSLLCLGAFIASLIYALLHFWCLFVSSDLFI